jgi:hypothetical protein
MPRVSTASFLSTAVDATGTIYAADALGLLAFYADGKQSGTWPILAAARRPSRCAWHRPGTSSRSRAWAPRDRCTLAESEPDRQQVATWHASTPVAHPGTRVDVGGHGLYLQCVGSGSPTIVWEAGAVSSGWTGTAQYLMGKLAETSRVCVYDRAGLGWSEPGPYEDVSHWSAVVADLHTALEKTGERSVRDGRSLYGGLRRLPPTRTPRKSSGRRHRPGLRGRVGGPVVTSTRRSASRCFDASARCMGTSRRCASSRAARSQCR